MARIRNMRYSGPRPKAGQYPAQLGRFSVTATADDVEAFARSWPGSGFPDRGFTAYFEANGDLVDLSGWAADFRGDGYALSVLIDEMKEYGLDQQRGRRRNPAALRKAAHVYGKRWVIEGFPGYRRLYVHRTNVGSYVVSDSEHLSLDSMLEIDDEYHFGTLKQLKAALARAERTRNPRRRSRRKSAKRRRNFASGWRYIRNLPDNYPLATGSPNARRSNGIHGEKIGEHRGVAIYVNRSGTALSAPSLKLYGYAYERNLMRDIDRALARKRKWARK